MMAEFAYHRADLLKLFLKLLKYGLLKNSSSNSFKFYIYY